MFFVYFCIHSFYFIDFMRIKIVFYLLCFLLLFVGCVDRKAEKVRKAIEENEKFQANFPDSYRELLRKYKEKEIPIVEKSIQLTGGVFCLVNNVHPWKSFNKRLQDDGYCVTLQQDSLSYFIFTESISHLEGYYDNGGRATRIEKLIIALDVSNEMAYILKRDVGGMPPHSISRRRGSDTGVTGRYMTDDDVYSYLVSIISKVG